MPSVLNIVQHLNQMKASEMRSVFTKNRNSPNTNSSRSALHPHYFKFENITEQTRWQRKELLASFPQYLLRFSEDLAKRVDFSNVFQMNENIRFCSICFSKSCHLIFHQFNEWSLCPIHKTPLGTDCPRCGERFGDYSVDLNLDSAFRCLSCRLGLIENGYQLDKDLDHHKRKMLDEYSAWCNSTNKTLSGDEHSKYLFVSKPNHYSQVAAYYTLLGGPSWFKECLRDCNQSLKYSIRNHNFGSKVSSILKKGKSEVSANQMEADNKNLQATLTTGERVLREQLPIAYRNVAENVIATYPWIRDSFDKPITLGGKNVTFSMNGNNGTSQILDMMSDEIFGFFINSEAALYSTNLWREWRAGPGRLLDSLEKQNNSSKTANQKWGTEVSNSWLEAVLLLSYKKLLLSTFVSNTHFPEIYERGAVISTAFESYIFGFGSIYAAKENNMIEISSIASLSEFGSVIRKNRDVDRSTCPSQRYGKELFGLVACHSEQRERLENLYCLIASENRSVTKSKSQRAIPNNLGSFENRYEYLNSRRPVNPSHAISSNRK